MARYDFSAPRLFVDATAEALAPAALVALDKAQQNYLCNVLRLSEGGTVLVFNGRDGEWRASLVAQGRRTVALRIEALVRDQTAPGGIHYVFAPLKHARLDYIVQKAVEMGACALHPVLTRHTQVARVNLERMRANAIEAAEQCGILTLPQIAAPTTLAAFLHGWGNQLVVFCDEDAPPCDPRHALHALAPCPVAAVLVGPEGGFDQTERAQLLALPNHVRLSLGPRILRADTAGVAALTLVQSTVGDWASASP